MRIRLESLHVKFHVIIEYLKSNEIPYDIELSGDLTYWFIDLPDFDGNMFKIRHPDYFKDVQIKLDEL